ncbi:glycosyltransferase family 4 protein, partial [Candidatus Daviesbacteria bacterium]|nr:glycosyltransferase family 4 protein [Candidatus Daviesbacteria bacterium]
MNILILSWRGSGHPNAGGAEISTQEHAGGWVAAGHRVTLFTSDYAGSKKEEVVDGVKIIRAGPQVFGVQIEALKWYLFKSHPKFDLIIDQFHGIPFFTPFFVRSKKLAFIHEVTKEIWKLNPWPKPWYFIPAIVGKFIEPLIFRIFYRKVPFMTVSQSTKNDLISWGIPGGNITIIHNGVTIPHIKMPAKENKKTLIYLGSLSKDKGIEDALQVFSILKNQDFQFWVVGKSDPRYLNFLQKMCYDLGIEKQVKFWGFVSEKEKF